MTQSGRRVGSGVQGKAGTFWAHFESRVALAVAVLTIDVPILVLLGWLANNDLLKRIHPGLTSMNPVTALLFIMLGVSLMMVNWRVGKARQRRVAAALQVVIGLVGLVVVVRYFTHWNLPVDRWLFPSRLDSPGYPPSKIAPNTGLNFLLVAVALLWPKRAGRPWRWPVAQTALYVSALSVVVALFGYAYGFSWLYRVGDFVPMALHTAILFLCIIAAVSALHTEWRVTRFFRRLPHVIWVGLLIIILTLTLTGIAWRQNQTKTEQQQTAQFNQDYTEAAGKIEGRLNDYINTLHGFQAFFVASDYVSRGDFHSYFSSLNLAQHYPGIRAISLVREVPAKDAAAFTRQMRTDTTYPAQNQPNFTIHPSSNHPTYYVATYVEPISTNFGFDLGSDNSRLSNLLAARDAGAVSASATVDFNVRNPAKPKLYGFFITEPLYIGANGKITTEKSPMAYGYINASFEYQKLFDKLLTESVGKGLSIRLYDQSSGTPLYQQTAKAAGGSGAFVRDETISAAGRPWRLTITAPADYALSRGARQVSWAILASGMLAAGTLLTLFWSLARSRQRAVVLATKMTKDLHRQRDKAVAMQQKDEAILSSIGDAVFALDMNHRIVLFNPSAAHLSGYEQDEALGKTFHEVLKFVDEKTGKSATDFITRAMEGHVATMARHTMLVRKDGTKVPVADSAAPIRGAGGAIEGVIVVFHDISKEEELDRAKTEFVSLASHQLRTPLSAVNWISELLMNEEGKDLSRAQRQHIQEIYRENQRMIELVNSLLDVSRLDLGKFVNQPQAVSLLEQAESLERELEPQIKQKHLSCKVEVAAATPQLMADPKLTRMILQNLLSNAVKYTAPTGSVNVEIRAATPPEITGRKLPAGPYVYIAVTDTGYGIPRAQQSKIFGKMFRADNVTSLDVEGTGLGLYIVKQVVERLGGRVWFVSAEKVGSTFYVLLPEVTKATTPTDA